MVTTRIKNKMRRSISSVQNSISRNTKRLVIFTNNSFLEGENRNRKTKAGS